MKNLKQTIAIVDDNPKNLQLLASLLNENNFKPVLFKSGDQLMEFLETSLPNLILLDIMMPDKNGYQVANEIKEQKFYTDIPIIFITAKTDVNDIVKGFEAGAVDYISKPFNKHELLARISTHLELNAARKELIELSAMKEKMFSLVVHDLRSPFNAIMGFSDIIVNEYEDLTKTEIVEIAANIYKSSKGAIGLIENLMEWAKIQLNKISFKPEEINLYESIENTIDLSKLYSKKKQILIEENIPQDIKIYTDKNLLNTVIRNLLSNAIKFTSQEGQIKITAKKVNEHVELSVKDSGIGISEENIQKLFKENEYYTTKGTSNEKGSGIGLFLCKNLIKKLSGDIWVNSQPGEGSEFVFTLPISKINYHSEETMV